MWSFFHESQVCGQLVGTNRLQEKSATWPQLTCVLGRRNCHSIYDVMVGYKTDELEKYGTWSWISVLLSRWIFLNLQTCSQPLYVVTYYILVSKRGAERLFDVDVENRFEVAVFHVWHQTNEKHLDMPTIGEYHQFTTRQQSFQTQMNIIPKNSGRHSRLYLCPAIWIYGPIPVT